MMSIKKMFESFIPFLVIGISIAVGIALLLMFFSIAIWGLLIAAVLWLIATAKQYLFPDVKPQKQEGRIIEHDDKR